MRLLGLSEIRAQLIGSQGFDSATNHCMPRQGKRPLVLGCRVLPWRAAK